MLEAPAPTRLTWEIEPRDGGLSRLRVSHATQDAPRTAAIVSGSRPEAGGGWPYILRDLKALLETGKPAAPRASGGPDAVDA